MITRCSPTGNAHADDRSSDTSAFRVNFIDSASSYNFPAMNILVCNITNVSKEELQAYVPPVPAPAPAPGTAGRGNPAGFLTGALPHCFNIGGSSEPPLLHTPPQTRVLLPAATTKRIRQFVFEDDRRRALLSELLQRAALCHYLAKPHPQPFSRGDEATKALLRGKVPPLLATIRRTRENKPYPVLLDPTPGVPETPNAGDGVLGTWNFNVSHHGDYVAIASHPYMLVGLDIVDTTTRSPLSGGSRGSRGVKPVPNGEKVSGEESDEAAAAAREYFGMFDGQFTAAEMRYIHGRPSVCLQYSAFYLTWSLKEAFIKAVGEGLHFDLKRIHFDITWPAPGCDSSGDNCTHAATEQSQHSGPASIATVAAFIDGRRREDWRFDCFHLDTADGEAGRGPVGGAAPSRPKYICSVARGPVCTCCQTYMQAAWEPQGLTGPATSVPSSGSGAKNEGRLQVHPQNCIHCCCANDEETTSGGAGAGGAYAKMLHNTVPRLTRLSFEALQAVVAADAAAAGVSLH